MAKINVSIDTESSVMEVTLDGETVPADSVSAYSYKDYYENEMKVSVSIDSTTKQENGVTKRTCIYAHNMADKAERDIAQMFMGRIK